jgi:hypothetical protein
MIDAQVQRKPLPSLSKGKPRVAVEMSLLCLVVALLMLARFPLVGQLWGMRFDLLFHSPEPGFASPTFIMISLLCAAICILTGIILAATKHRGVRWCWLVFALLGVLPGLGWRHSPATRDLTYLTQQGNLIVQALNRYYKDTGHYPDRLDGLVPRYLDRIPATGVGSRRPFHYCRRNSVPPQENWVTSRCDFWLGDAPYALVVEFVPAGTVVFCPGGHYENLGVQRVVNGWGWTSID